MKKATKEILLDLHKCLNIPLRTASKEESSSGDVVLTSVLEFNYKTIDEVKFNEEKEEISFRMQLLNVKNIRTIKHCIVFMTSLIAISLALWGIYFFLYSDILIRIF